MKHLAILSWKSNPRAKGNVTSNITSSALELSLGFSRRVVLIVIVVSLMRFSYLNPCIIMLLLLFLLLFCCEYITAVLMIYLLTAKSISALVMTSL